MKTPARLGVLQISIGVISIISIILSGYVLLCPGIAVLVAVQILSIVLLIVGIERIAIGIFSPYHRSGLKLYTHAVTQNSDLTTAAYNIVESLSSLEKARAVTEATIIGL